MVHGGVPRSHSGGRCVSPRNCFYSEVIIKSIRLLNRIEARMASSSCGDAEETKGEAVQGHVSDFATRHQRPTTAER